MKTFLYGLGLQFKLDIRSKTMLITAYIVPLIFFFLMGGIFTSVNPTAVQTLIPSMSIFVITMSSLIGLPPSLAEIYGSDIKKVYKANGMPLSLGVITQFISSFIHTLIVCLIIFTVAPFAFKAELPANLPLYFCSLITFICVALAIGSVLGVMIKSQSKLTMVGMLIFLPSIMLSGIMFPATMLPNFMQHIAYIFPATIGFQAMSAFQIWHLPVLLSILAVLIFAIVILLKKRVLNR